MRGGAGYLTSTDIADVVIADKEDVKKFQVRTVHQNVDLVACFFWVCYTVLGDFCFVHASI